MKSQEEGHLLRAASQSVELSQGLVKRLSGENDAVRHRLLAAQQALVRTAFHLQMVKEMTEELE